MNRTHCKNLFGSVKHLFLWNIFVSTQEHRVTTNEMRFIVSVAPPRTRRKTGGGFYTWPQTARLVHAALVTTIAILVLFPHGTMWIPIVFHRVPAAFPSAQRFGGLLEPLHIYIIVLLCCLTASVAILMADALLLRVSRCRRAGVVDRSFKQERHPAWNDGVVAFHLAVVDTLRAIATKMLLVLVGFARGLALVMIVLGALGMHSLNVLQILGMILEGSQVPLAASLQLTPYTHCTESLVQGFFLGVLASAGLVAMHLYANPAIQHYVLRLEQSAAASDLARRRLRVLHAMENHRTFLFCRSDQLLCQLQKRLLGITQQLPGIPNLPPLFMAPDTLSAQRETPPPRRRPASPSSFSRETQQWHRYVQHATYRLPLTEAEQELLPPIDEQGGDRDPPDIQKRLHQMGRIPAQPVVQDRPTYTVINEELVDPQLFQREVEPCLHNGTMRRYLPPKRLFTYIDRRYYREPPSRTRRPPPALPLRRDAIVDCAVALTDRAGLTVSCPWTPGREFDFLMALSASGSPTWVFEDGFYPGILTLQQLETAFSPRLPKYPCTEQHTSPARSRS